MPLRVCCGNAGRQTYYSSCSPKPNGTTWEESSRKQSLSFYCYTLTFEMLETFQAQSSPRIKCQCQEAAVRSACTSSSQASLIKVNFTHGPNFCAFSWSNIYTFVCYSFLNNCVGWFGRLLPSVKTRFAHLPGKDETSMRKRFARNSHSFSWY